MRLRKTASHREIRWVLGLLVVAACGRPAEAPSGGSARPERSSVGSADAASRGFDATVIARLWPDGCFTARDPAGAVHASDRGRCAAPRRPYSTFKLANALIAIDAGVLEGPDAAMTWDRLRVPDQVGFRDEWRRPHTLRSGMKVSAVPYFRTLALQLGAARMEAGLAKLDYGNREMTGGLDRFWLAGGLRISAAQQLAFVEALARGRLAVSARAQAVVREVTVIAEAGGAVLHGKTGAGHVEEGRAWLVWQVGWVERAGELVPYAAWLESEVEDIDEVRALRDRRLRATLDALGVLPAQ
jgi:beta-lactamase class D